SVLPCLAAPIAASSRAMSATLRHRMPAIAAGLLSDYNRLDTSGELWYFGLAGAAPSAGRARIQVGSGRRCRPLERFDHAEEEPNWRSDRPTGAGRGRRDRPARGEERCGADPGRGGARGVGAGVSGGGCAGAWGAGEGGIRAVDDAGDHGTGGDGGRDGALSAGVRGGGGRVGGES